MGFDLNRYWQTPSPWAQPTIYATKNLLLQYNQNPVMFCSKKFYKKNHLFVNDLR